MGESKNKISKNKKVVTASGVSLLVIAIIVLVFMFSDFRKVYPETQNSNEEEVMTEITEETVVSNEDVKNEVVPANNYKEFYLNTFNQYFSQKSDNFLYSPYSEKLALTGVLLGMDTESVSYHELSEALGIKPNDLEGYLEETRINLESLSKISDLSLSNSIWYDTKNLDENFPSYCKEVDKRIGLECFEDTLSSQEFVNRYNDYVSSNTNNMITEVIKQPLSSDTSCVLTNVLHLDAEWINKFKKESTREGEFNGKIVKDVMHMTDKFEYASKSGLDLVKLPYTDGLEMIIIKATGDGDTIEKWDSLSLTHQIGMLDGDYAKFKEKKVFLSLPKFDVKSNIDLTESLKSLGIQTVFLNGDRLPKVSKNISIGGIIQDARVKCDEEGTEAAAVTSVYMIANSAMPVKEEIVDFIVDKSFIFVIRDTKTEEYIMMGYICQV